MRLEPGQVAIRAYCHGLGDCFLLRFGRENEEPFSMVIDCGIILGTPSPEVQIRPVVQDIFKETGGELAADGTVSKRAKVDLLVNTHEHWDHLSGFIQAQSDWDAIDFDQVWFAWTERKGDKLADDLRKEMADKKEKLKRAKEKGAGLADPKTGALIESLLGLFGDGALDGALGAAGGKTTLDALNYIKGRFAGREEAISYKEPGVAQPLVPGIRVYFLGPPHRRERLMRTLPGKDKEVYEGLALTQESAFMAALDDHLGNPLTPEEQALCAKARPFDSRDGASRADAQKNGFFARTYFEPTQDWRSIDGDWLAGAEELALALDSATNNTSLAMAFELPNGKFLLFPGDAQVGNWLSWYDQPYILEDGTKRTIDDILPNVCFYKAGHHGSHNATLRELGLEKMPSGRFSAFVPVDTHVAHEKKGWCNMPLPALVNRLREKSDEVVLADEVMVGQPLRYKDFLF
jgi:hypothetical protein